MTNTPQSPEDSQQVRAPVIGILALQGDVREHEQILIGLDVAVQLVRTPEELSEADALVLPGGESTTLSMLLESSGLLEVVRDRLTSGMPALGTCAGMILLSNKLLDGRADQHVLGGIDIAVRRNAYGRQLESFETDLVLAGHKGAPMHAVFIRAPQVESVGDGVEIIATVERDGAAQSVICRQGRVTVSSFHPELTGESRLHEWLVDDARAVLASQPTGSSALRDRRRSAKS